MTRPFGCPRASYVAALLVAASLVTASSRVSSAQELTDTITTSYELNGLRILHHRTSSHVVAASLYLLGGARQVTAANAGIEPFLLYASEYGTTDYPGEATRRATARTGSSIAVESGYDWTSFSMHGLREEFDSTWAVFTSRVLQPSLDSTAMAIVRARMLTIVRRARTSPDAQAAVLAESLAFNGHPYAVDPGGNEASIRALTPEDLRRYAREQFVTSRMLLVVVGDVPRDRLDRLVTATLGTLPKGEYAWTLPAPVTPAKAAVAAAHRVITTNYVYGIIPGPRRSSPDYPAFEYSMGILSNFVSSVIREKEGLSYAAGVPMMSRGASSAAIYVSTARPDTVMKLVNWLLGEYERELWISAGNLRKSAEGFRSEYVFGMETASSHADMLASAQLYDGDYRAAARKAEVMAKIRFPDLRRMVRTHAKNIQYGYVGDTTRMPRAEMLKR